VTTSPTTATSVTQLAAELRQLGAPQLTTALDAVSATRQTGDLAGLVLTLEALAAETRTG
jgi:hypothetical protein